jgi:hypothetical protein
MKQLHVRGVLVLVAEDWHNNGPGVQEADASVEIRRISSGQPSQVGTQGNPGDGLRPSLDALDQAGRLENPARGI